MECNKENGLKEWYCKLDNNKCYGWNGHLSNKAYSASAVGKKFKCKCDTPGYAYMSGYTGEIEDCEQRTLNKEEAGEYVL
jgi:hypothetical protein